MPPKSEEERPFFISIQGNIGSGKSTILKIIRESLPELAILDEPLSEWEKVGEKEINLLSLYYQQPSRWGFTFQIYAFMTRLAKWSEYSRLGGSGIKISERSLLSDRYIFASIMRDLSLLDESEHAIYTQFYDHLTRINRIVDLTGILYVYCPPETCLQRIKKRSRQGEEAIPADYLARIHQKHEEWLNPPQKLENVLILDNSVPIDRQKIIEMVKEWIALRKDAL